MSIMACICLVTLGIVCLLAGIILYRSAMAITGWRIGAELSWLLLDSVATDASSITQNIDGHGQFTTWSNYIAVWFAVGVVFAVFFSLHSFPLLEKRVYRPGLGWIGIAGGLVIAKLCRVFFHSAPPFLHLVLLPTFCLVGYVSVQVLTKLAISMHIAAISAYSIISGLDTVIAYGITYESVNRTAGGGNQWLGKRLFGNLVPSSLQEYFLV